jgi:hypothetical protein
MTSGRLAPISKLQPGGRRVLHSLPDVILAVLFATAAAAPLFPENGIFRTILESRHDLYFALYVEAGFLVLQLVLVDLATRLRRKPSTGTMVAMVVVAVLFLGLPLQVLHAAWSMGIGVFVSMLFSLVDRGAILRHLPDRPRIEKVAARALISNRIITASVLLGSFVAAVVIVVAFTPNEWPDESWPQLAAGALYFAIAAFDDWRVRGRRFAEKPRVLFGYEVLRIEMLDPL